MFDVITATWNPVIGCYHNCTYCWAVKMAKTKLHHMEKYKDGFKPKLVEYELEKKFTNKFVFAVDMGDLFGKWVPREWILKVIKAVEQNPESYFLFLTKNPSRYHEFIDVFPKNVVLGATIETNRSYPFSDAPSPIERYKAMANLKWENKLISIEPIMNFDLDIFVQWMNDIKPKVVYIGFDNYGHRLPEPSKIRTLQLVAKLEKFTRVRKKWEKQKGDKTMKKKNAEIPKTSGGYDPFEVLSALQKEIRRGNEYEAVYWATELATTNPQMLWKRLRIIASEDVGPADPVATMVIDALKRNWDSISRKNGASRLFMVHAVLHLARAPKSRTVDDLLITIYGEMGFEKKKLPIPDYALDTHTVRGKMMGRGFKHFLEEGAKLNNETLENPYKESAARILLKYGKP